MADDIKYEYKEVNVPAGFTEDGRKKNLKKLESKMEKDGWSLDKYFDGGLTKTSVATFKRDLNYKPIKSTSSLGKNIVNTIAFLVVISVVYSFVSSPDNEEIKDSNNTPVTTKKVESEIYYKKYENTTLKDIREKTNGTLKKIAFSFAKENNISEDYYNTMYDCLAYNTYNKSQDLTVNTMLGWCNNDYINKDKKAVYYNSEWLLEDFSSWDGSYRPLEKIIKANMNDTSSYDHIKTTYRMVFFGTKRPYMFVTTKFSGKNAFGGVVKQDVSVKVDAKTKELFDLE